MSEDKKEDPITQRILAMIEDGEPNALVLGRDRVYWTELRGWFEATITERLPSCRVLYWT